MRIKRQPAAVHPPDFDPRHEIDSEQTPLDWPRHTGRLDQVMAAIAVRKKRRRRHRMQAVAAGAVLIAAGLGWMFGPPGSRAHSERTAQTHPVVSLPERRMLPDGSIVDLKDGSEIAIDFGGELRHITLRNGGAHFQVATDPARTFVVEAGGMKFRAVGTAFAVQLSSSKVEMLVTEGTVAVDRAPIIGAASGPSTAGDVAPVPLALVDAGNQVAVNLEAGADIASPQVTPLSPAESGEKLAWRIPRLELNDTPLAEAIAAINQHSPVSLEMGQAELGKLGISGVLRADNVEPLLRMLESNYGIRADRRHTGKIILRKER